MICFMTRQSFSPFSLGTLDARAGHERHVNYINKNHITTPVHRVESTYTDTSVRLYAVEKEYRQYHRTEQKKTTHCTALKDANATERSATPSEEEGTTTDKRNQTLPLTTSNHKPILVALNENLWVVTWWRNVRN